MPVRYAAVSDLVSAITDSASDRTILVGAAVSACEPSCLPDAATWVSWVVADIAERAHFRPKASLDLLTVVDQSTNRLAVPLEVLLAVLDETYSDLGARIAATVGAGVPHNTLHEVLAEVVSSGRSQIVTTNFDMQLEQAYLARTGISLKRWVIDDRPFDSSALLFKVHGSADLLPTLRHSLSRINRPFDKNTLNGMRSITSSTVVIIGHAGSDYDVLDILTATDPSCGPVFWLALPDRMPLEAASQIATAREVCLVEGSFDDLLCALKLPSPNYKPDGRHVRSGIKLEVGVINQFEACEVLAKILFQARVAQDAVIPLYQDFRFFLRLQSGKGYRKLYHHVQASEYQFDAGFGIGLIVACIHFVLGSTRGLRWRALSDSAEVLERLGYGLVGPLARIVTWPIHGLAARHATGIERTRLQLRFVRSLSVLLSPEKTIVFLDRIFRDTDNDTYLEGIILLRKAVALALKGSGNWGECLAKAQKNFLFEGRTAEIGDSQRLAAVCAFANGEFDRASELLASAVSYQRAHGQIVGARQARILLVSMRRFPRLSRLAIRLI